MINTEFNFDESTKVNIIINKNIYKDYEWVARYEELSIKTNVTIIYKDDAISKEIIIQSTPDYFLNNPASINDAGECVRILVRGIEVHEEFFDFIEDYRYSKDKACTCGDPNDCECLNLLFEENIEVKVEAISFEITDNLIYDDMLTEFNDILYIATKKEELEDILKTVHDVRNEWLNQLALSEALAERVIPKRFRNEFFELCVKILRTINELDAIFEKIKEISNNNEKSYNIDQRRGSWATASHYEYVKEIRDISFWSNECGIYSCELHSIEIIDDEECEKYDVFNMRIDEDYIDGIMERYLSNQENLISGIIVIKDKIGTIERDIEDTE